MSSGTSQADITTSADFWENCGLDKAEALRMQTEFRKRRLSIGDLAAKRLSQSFLRNELGLAKLGKRLTFIEAAAKYVNARSRVVDRTILSGVNGENLSLKGGLHRIRREERSKIALEAERQAAHKLARVAAFVIVVVVAYIARLAIPELLITRGIMLRTSGLNNEAVHSYHLATYMIWPQEARGRAFLGKGKALAELGRRDEAMKSMDEAFLLGVEAPDAKHMLAAWRGGATKMSAKDEHKYVETLFDSYSNFDEHSEALHYRAPQVLQMAVKAAVNYKDGKTNAWDILDLGCGTGLAGIAFAKIFSNARQVGVDISRNMIETAKTRNVYTELHHLEIGAYLQEAEPGSFDIVVAADVFVYVRGLEKIFSLCAAALRPGGFLAFTIERIVDHVVETDNDRILQESGRYAFSQNLIRNLAKRYKYRVVHEQNTNLRQDHGVAIPGTVYVLRALR